MKTASYARILLTTLCLLTLATSASAECAWVLWASSSAGRPWVVADAYDTKGECLTVENRGNRNGAFLYRCLPSTDESVRHRGPAWAEDQMIRVPVVSLLTAILIVVTQTPATALCLTPMEANATPAMAVNHQYVWFLVESLAHARIGWQETDSAADSPNPAARLADLKLAVDDFQCAASLVQRFQSISGPDKYTAKAIQVSALAATSAYTTFATGFQQWVTATVRGQGGLPLEAAADFKVQNEKAGEFLIQASTAAWFSLFKAAPDSQTPMDRLTLTRLLEGLKRRRFRPDPDQQSPDTHTPDLAAALLYQGLSNPKFKSADEP
jgi:hypothetical protein